MSKQQQDQATATVAPGRSLLGDRKYVPGDAFTASAAEVRRPQRLGYLLDPQRRTVPVAGTHAMQVVRSPSVLPGAKRV